MSAPQPAAFSGQFQLAADQSLPQDGIPFSYSGTFVALEAALLNIGSSPGSISVPMPTLPAAGAKGLLIRYDSQAAPATAIQVTINGGSAALELTPGGMLVYFNPAPALGVTSVSIAYTAACQLRVWVLG